MTNSKRAVSSCFRLLHAKEYLPYEAGSFFPVILPSIQQDKESIGEKGKPLGFSSLGKEMRSMLSALEVISAVELCWPKGLAFSLASSLSTVESCAE